jgi:MoaA/NifB/PqqE/SkfB family radical SAM enzyme
MKLHILADRKNISDLGITATVSSEFINPYTNLTINKYSDIFKNNGVDAIVRFESSGLPIPPSFWGNFLKAWRDNNFYIKCTGKHIHLEGLLIEMFTNEALDIVKNGKHHFLPDTALNIFSDKRSAPYWLNLDEQRFYLLENYSLFYNKPKGISIETTPHCNLRCVKCQYHSAKSPYTNAVNRSLPGSSMMKYSEWTRIIDEASDFSNNLSISPAVRGECLLNKDIVKMVKYASGKGHSVSFFTNGNLLNGDVSKALIDAGIRSIAFSIDAIDKERYDKLQPGGDFGKVVENVEKLVRIRGNKSSPSINVNFCESVVNSEDFEKYLRFWKDRVDSVTTSVELDINKRHMPWKTFYLVSFRYPCSWLWSYMYVHSNGQVATCGLDIFHDRKLGNVFERDILSVWNSESYMAIRRKQASERRDLSFCQSDISWTGSYFIEKIENDEYQCVGPMFYSVSKHKNDSFMYNFAHKVKRTLVSSKVPAGVVNKLQRIYLRRA